MIDQSVIIPRSMIWTVTDHNGGGPRTNLIIRQFGETELDAEINMCQLLSQLFKCNVVIEGEDEIIENSLQS